MLAWKTESEHRELIYMVTKAHIRFEFQTMYYEMKQACRLAWLDPYVCMYCKGRYICFLDGMISFFLDDHCLLLVGVHLRLLLLVPSFGLKISTVSMWRWGCNRIIKPKSRRATKVRMYLWLSWGKASLLELQCRKTWRWWTWLRLILFFAVGMYACM